MLFFGCEVVVLSSPPDILLFALWVRLVSPILGFLWRGWGGCFYHGDSSPILSGLKYITPNMGQYKPSATSELTQTSLETTRLINWPNKEQKYHALQKPLFTSSAIRHRIDNLSTRHSHNMTAQSTTSKIT
jgi:hypothetical protein